MNYYKFKMMVKEFSFLEEILRKKARKIYWASPQEQYEEKWLSETMDRHRDELGLQVVTKNNYKVVSYIENPDSLNIKRGDENLFSQTPSYNSYSWCDGGHDDYTSYCAVVEEKVFWLKLEGSSRTGSGDNHEEDVPTIGEQLAQLKIDPDYIVCVDFQDTDDNDNGDTYKKVVIYKMNKFNLADYHCRQIDKVASWLKAEITAACKGGA